MLRALHKLGEVVGEDMALFCVVDEHLHVVLVCDEATRAVRTRALSRAFRALAAVSVDPPRVRTVNGRNHMANVFSYVLTQPSHHNLPVHPALWPGSCLPDLLGARALPGVRLRLREAMQRVTEADILNAVGLDIDALVPMDDERIRAQGARRLLLAAAAVMAADPSLQGRGGVEVTARRLACNLGSHAGMPVTELAWLLKLPVRSVRRMTTAPVDEALTDAVRRRLALEERVRTSMERYRR